VKIFVLGGLLSFHINLPHHGGGGVLFSRRASLK